MSKPREFAHLIKKQFGSADNINSIPSKSPPEMKDFYAICTLLA